MATLTSMMKTAAELKEGAANAPEAVSEDNPQPKYPYGLTIYLSDETLEKLGMTTLPAIGSTMTLTARVQVTGVNQNQSTDKDGVTRDVNLQITDMALGPDTQTSSPADRMYKPEQGE